MIIIDGTMLGLERIGTFPIRPSSAEILWRNGQGWVGDWILGCIRVC